MKPSTDTKELIRAAVADGHSHAIFVCEQVGASRQETTRLLNILAREVGSGVVKKTRGVYVWNEEVKRPKMQEAFSIKNWLVSKIKTFG